MKFMARWSSMATSSILSYSEEDEILLKQGEKLFMYYKDAPQISTWRTDRHFVFMYLIIFK